MNLQLKTTNTILYCRKWAETVDFYRTLLELPVTFESDWFVEFQLSDTAHISIADERRAGIKSSGGQGVTLTMQVEDIQTIWEWLHSQGINVGPIKSHRWGAKVFYFFDPEGYRLEIWSPTSP
ncbi:MAG: VOC family protein [Anaerolineae bacterium]|nr:VOC family protein [Anaerolineae bacterium]